MNRFSKYSHILSVALILTALPSCIYDDLAPCHEEDIEITIENDWSNAPDADPEGMAYLFFRDGVDAPWRFDFPGRQAGKVTVPEGLYRFVMFNDDTSNVIFKTSENGMPFATTSSEKMEIDGRPVETLEAPDMMWGASVSELRVDRKGVEYSSGDSMEENPGSFIFMTHPRQITPTYTVIINHVENLQGVTAMRGMISGMADGFNIFGETPSQTEALICFSPHSETDSSVKATFHTFGLPLNPQNPNELRLYFLLSDNRLVCKTFDVTRTINSSPDPMNVNIIIDYIALPYAPAPMGPGAFDPDVLGWNTIIVNLGT